MGLGMTASDPCLAGVLHICSFVLFTIWVTPENRLAKLALRGSSVLTQYFRGPQMACDSGWVKKLSVHVHKPANSTQSSGTVLFHWTRILWPRDDSNSMDHSSGCGVFDVCSSTKAALLTFPARFGRRLCLPSSLCFRSA